MSSDGMINDLINKRNSTLTSAYNTLNEELKAKFGNIEQLGGDIEKISGVVAGGLASAKGIKESIEKVRKKFKKKNNEDEEGEEGEEEGIDDLENVGENLEETASNTIDNVASSASDAVSNTVSNIGNMVSSKASSLISSARQAIENGLMKGQRQISNVVKNIKNIGQPKEAINVYDTEPKDPEEGIEMQDFGESKVQEGSEFESKVSEDAVDEGADIAEDIGESAGEIAGETAGEIAGEGALEGVGTALDASGFGAIIGVPLQILGAVGLISSVGAGIGTAAEAGAQLNENLKTNAENLQKAKQQAVNVAGKFSIPSFSSVNAFNI
tara:strand:- start:2703 stop:3683 length:981 start_codon:yes stop_codon:yes gene_type:complete